MIYQVNLLQDSFTLSTQLVSLSEYKIWVDFCAFDPILITEAGWLLNGL